MEIKKERPGNKERCRAYYRANRDRMLDYAKEYRERNRERNKEKSLEYYYAHRDDILKHMKESRDSNIETINARASNPAYHANKLVVFARSRARKSGIPFDDSIRERIVSSPPKMCACCGKELDYSRGRGKSDMNRSPSLDRLIPEKGYTENNTVVICYRCNRLKSDASIEDLEIIIAYMRRHILRNSPFTKYAIKPSSAN